MRRNSSMMLISLSMLLALMMSAVHPTFAQPAEPTPPSAAAQQDRCEPNNTPAQACELALDAVNGPFTLLPAGDADHYRVDLGANPTGLALEVTVRATSGLELRTEIRRGDTDEALTVLNSPAISTTLSADLTGWIALRVENRAPAIPSGESYVIELRRVLPPPPPVPNALAARPSLTPDALENNWNPATAAPIGVGVVYELNFVCPVPRGCAGGDHDYLAVPVKAGLTYLIATFDLGPGVDTALDLFWGDMQTPAASNDDANPGASFLSVVHWTAPANGMLIVRIGPRTGGVNPVVFDKNAGSYRFVMALSDSDLAAQLERRIAEQTNASATTSTTSQTCTTATAIPTAPVLTDGPTGAAIVIASSTTLRDAPAADAAIIKTLPQESMVTLSGQVSGMWVRVQPENSVAPGWVMASDLRLMTEGAMPTPIQPSAAQTSEQPALPTPQPTTVSRPAPRISRLEPVPPTPPAVSPRATLTVRVAVLAVNGAIAPNSTRRATPLPQRPLAGIRVQLVTVFGDVLAEAVTPDEGRVTLTRDIDARMALMLRLPALGVQTPIDPAQSVITIVIPAGGER